MSKTIAPPPLVTGLVDSKFLITPAVWKQWFVSLYTQVKYLLVSTVVTSITSDTTLTVNDYLSLVDASSAAVTMTLPSAASTNGQQFIIKKTDSSSNTVTIDGNGSETIDGDTTLVINFQYDSATLVSDGTSWSIV